MQKARASVGSAKRVTRQSATPKSIKSNSGANTPSAVKMRRAEKETAKATRRVVRTAAKSKGEVLMGE